MQEIDFYAAETLDQLYDLLTDTGGRMIAGGTDVLVQMQRGLFPAQTLIDASRIDDLRYIRADADRIHIGALTTYADLLASSLLREAAPALLQAAETVGAPQTRARGTVGGNIGNASPAGDLLPPLLTLNAEITLASRDHERVLSLADVLIGPRQTILEPGEIIHSVSFARLSERSGMQFLKLGNRHGMAIAVVNAAVVLTLADDGTLAEARIALGAVAPTAVRCPHAEAILVGQTPSAALFAQTGQAIQADIAPITDLRGSAEYRRRAAAQLVQRALMMAAERVNA